MTNHQRTGSGDAPSQTAVGGIRTFSRLPVLDAFANGAIDLAILGIPFDSLVTYRPGARLGPNAIRQASVLCRNYSQQMEVAVFDRLRACDAGDLNLNPFDYQEAFRQIEDGIRSLQHRGASVVSLGGDHSILLPILRAMRTRHPDLTLIQFDAHSDVSDEGWHGQRYHHGTTIRRAIEEGILEGSRIFQIGIRGFIASAEYNDFSRQAGIRVLDMQGIHNSETRSAFLETVRSVAGGGPCYLSFDVDGVDPAFAPGTGTPVVGGLTSFEAIDMMRSLRGLNFIGGDVVEVAPPYDHAEITALLGAAIALEIGALIALARG
ncbi:MAG TPA: agmatinase [Terracidiphilus sp.]|nr:agmatinase [Terracidiphilus sp.]